MTTAKRFTKQDQDDFARWSGDYNPLHVDAGFAARTYPGSPVVHGMHLVLWALDQWCRCNPDEALSGFRVTFKKPVVIGDLVEASFERAGQVRLTVDGTVMAIVALKANHRLADAPPPIAAAAPNATAPDLRREDNLKGRQGALMLPGAAEGIAAVFPALAQRVGPEPLAGIAGVSTIIGMECPALHGMLSESSIGFGGASDPLRLDWFCRDHHAGFDRVDIQFAGSGIEGTVAAVAGRDDSTTLDAQKLKSLVRPGEFSGQSPLIVGASSGLGLATAGLIAAGGGTPVLSFTRDEASLAEAKALVESVGGQCRAAQIDVLAGRDAFVDNGALQDWTGREVYYFSSPRIFRRRTRAFQSSDFQDFVDFYVTGFADLVAALRQLHPDRPLSILYPSTVAIDEHLPDLFEYAEAKATGERLCDLLQAADPLLSIDIERLPRIATRQTNTVIRVAAEQADAVMLPIVRRVQAPRV